MEKSIVSQVIERFPRALELDRERAWQLVQSYPQLLGLKPPIPPKVRRLIDTHLRDLKTLEELKGTPPREFAPKSDSDTPYKPAYRRRLCRICKVVHEGKLPQSHFARLNKYRLGKLRWRGVTPEQRAAHMQMMCGHRRRQQYTRAIERRIAMLHPGFVAHIGYDAAFRFCEEGVRRHGWDFLITVPISLIKSHTVHWHDTAPIARFRQARFPNHSYDDLKAILQECLQEEVHA